MKGISRNIPRKLEREAKLMVSNMLDVNLIKQEFRTVFKASMNETDLDQINEIKMVMYTVLERIEQGVYPPFPKHMRI